MTKHPAFAPSILTQLGLSAVVALMICGNADAMPPFAIAYGAKCTLCHLQVPALNAFGRYVQRTGYAALDPKKLHQTLPVWVGFNPSYDSQGATGAHRLQLGNVAVHGVGALSDDWTYHVQQWIRQNNQPGGLDTAWISYNGLFKHYGHLFLGKLEPPAPSPFSQWFDLGPFGSPQITVGQHTYQLDANRWGARLAYVHNSLDVEASWLGSNGDLSGAGAFSANVDKTFQWKIAYANENRPLEVGLYGSRGSLHLSGGATDQYHSLAGYAELDPTGGAPGVFAVYQKAFDSNPGGGAGATVSSALSVELYQTLFRDNAIVGVRKEILNDGLGNRLQTGNIDFEYHVARFVNVYLEAYFAQHQKPGYRYMLWWTIPLAKDKPGGPVR
jgi:hypothetical protein